jgi:DNA-binding SARP family transcriptional activator
MTVVIQAKLAVPAIPERRVERPRLEDRLAALLLRHRVVVVSATAGAGKTTAVAAAVRRLEQPVAWLTLDWTDAAPGRLVTYLEAALARAVPRVAGTATRALAASIPHSEAAGLLAEAVGSSRAVLVIDELERLTGATEALAVLRAFLRYAPPALRHVLVSRRAVPAQLALPPTGGATAAVGESDLALTTEEAARALVLQGQTGLDAAAVVEATGGWLTGVLFEAWRAAKHVNGSGGEVDPLHGYLAAHILGQLEPGDRDFLETTALLPEVTAARAEALGIPDAATRLANLRAARLPVSWQHGGRSLRCHSRFREYLLERLERRGEAAVSGLRREYGRLLAREGYHEEATEELLRAGAAEDALASAERAIVGVLERLDIPLAERWLEALAGVAPDASPALTIAELLIALGGEDYRRGERLADRLAVRGQRERLSRQSGIAAALMAWCYALFGRLDDMRTVMAAAAPGPAKDALRYVMGHLEPGPRPPRPELPGGPLDALVLAVDYYYGRFSELDEHESSDWVDAVAAGPRRIGTLRSLGQTQRALELYEAAQARGRPSIQLDGHVGPELLLDARRDDEARAAAARARELARANGSPMFQAIAALSAAKLALRLDRDPAAARAALEEAERHVECCRYPLLVEQIDTWYGLALLLAGEDAQARVRLRRAVDSMTASERILELPTAAVYLAEAEWRAGDDTAADRAADAALEGAHGQGSNHLLLQALTDFPAVASRRIDAEPGVESAWHAIGRALIAQGTAVPTVVRASAELREFGRCEIVVDGTPRQPRIAKTYELLAYLITRPGERVERDVLLDALFDGRADTSTRAYLRQAIRWLRHALGTSDAVITEEGRVWLGDAVAVSGESTRFQLLLAEASRLQGAERLAATLDALEIAERGEYLPGARSQWADARRQELASTAIDARLEAAELAFAGGRLDDAERLATQVLAAEPFREAAWRLRMRLADALGAADAVVRAYHECERALADIGMTPSPATRELRDRLRR